MPWGITSPDVWGGGLASINGRSFLVLGKELSIVQFDYQ